jgi:hypothetical protein
VRPAVDGREVVAVHLRVAPDPGPGNVWVVDGVDVSGRARRLELTADPISGTRLTVEYLCREVVTATGEVEVVHRCPLGEGL